MERFVSDICEGACCFMCGASPQDKEFNDEHVIPKWILRKLDIYKLSITLPNDTKIRYGQYTVPCCKECNSFLGSYFEEDIAAAVDGGIEAVNSYILNNGAWKVFCGYRLSSLRHTLRIAIYENILINEEAKSQYQAITTGDCYTTFIAWFERPKMECQLVTSALALLLYSRQKLQPT